MQVEPSPETFAARYGRGEAQVVWTTLVADLETPVSAFLKIAGGRPMSFLLESVEGGATRGRYSILGLDPDIVVPTLNASGDEAKRAVETLNRGLSEDIFSEYVAKLENEIGVTINQGALNQVVSGGNAGDAN